MMARTHVAFGLCSGSVAASFYANNSAVDWGWNEMTLIAGVVVILGALFPDLDHRRSPLARLLPFVAGPVSRRWPHRTLMHSIVGLGLSTAVMWGLMQGCGWALWQVTGMDPRHHIGTLSGLFAFAYASHLILDTCTRTGVRWMYPIMHNPFGFPTAEQYRFITGDKRSEITVTAMSFALFLWFLPVTMAGADASINNLIGGYKQVKDVYVHAVGKEAILSFDGYLTRDKTSVSGEGVIVGVESGALLCYWRGRVWTIGEEQTEIYLLNGRCTLLDRPPVVETMTVRQSTWPDIMADVGRMGQGVKIVSGVLEADQAVKTDQYIELDGVHLSAKRLTMDWAVDEVLVGVRVAPREEGNMGDIDRQLQAAFAVLDTLTQERARLPKKALYERDRLFAQIEAHRGVVSRLERQNALGPARGGAVRWSGRLTVRRLDGDERE